MYKNILLLIDCSPVDATIVSHVAELAKVHGSKVHLFHVIHAHTLDQRRSLHAKAEECLQNNRAHIERAGVEADYSMSEGEPAEQILKKMDEMDMDLIALATHGHGFLGDMLFGSVSQTIKHKCCKPILLIRAE